MELSLYGISKEMVAMEDLWEMAIDEETGEVKDGAVLEELQNNIETTLKEKSTDIVKYYKYRKSLIESTEKEIKTLQELNKAREKKQKNFENYIKMCMEKMGKKKIETPNGNITWSAGRESVDYFDETLVPDEYRVEKVKVTKEISKTLIKEAIKKGIEVPGAFLAKKPSISIK